MEVCVGYDVSFYVLFLLKQKNWVGYMYYINLVLLILGSVKLKQFVVGRSFVLNKRVEKVIIDRLRDVFFIFLYVYV